MDRLIEITDKVSASQQEMIVDKKKCFEFMQKVRIWDFAKISQNDYHSYSKEAKIDLIEKYCSHLLRGKFCFIYSESDSKILSLNFDCVI